LAIIACGVANGYFFSGFGFPENLVFVLCTSIVCVGALIIHRRVTKDWEVPSDFWSENFHFPVFRLTLFFSVFGLIMMFVLREANATTIVACCTIATASLIAHTRERNYTDEWI